MTTLFKLGVKASLLGIASAALVSCNNPESPGMEFAPDMYHAISLEPLREMDNHRNPYNPNRMNMREPAKNTIARGNLGFYNHIGKDSADIAEKVLVNPLTANEAVLEDGKVLYSRFCDHCHGETGMGDGLVGAKFKGVANLNADNVKARSEGYVVHVIANGKGRMMPHGSQINPEERWKIAMYVKQMQNGGTYPGMPAADTAATTTGANANSATGTTTTTAETKN